MPTPDQLRSVGLGTLADILEGITRQFETVTGRPDPQTVDVQPTSSTFTCDPCGDDPAPEVEFE